MGTNYTGEGSSNGIIPKVMEKIFRKVQATKDTEFLIRVSFIEVSDDGVFLNFAFVFRLWGYVTISSCWNDRYSRKKFLTCLIRIQLLPQKMKGQLSLLGQQELPFKLEKLLMEGLH